MTEVPIIDQTISTVAPVKHRDTINPTIPATQDAFVQSAEAFFDKISDTTVNEINQVTTKIDTTVAAINIVAQEISEAATIAIASGQYKGDWVAGFETIGYSLGDGVTFTDGYNYVSKINNNLTTPITLTNTDQWNFIEAVNPNNYYLKTETYTQAEVNTLHEINNKTDKATPIDTDNFLIQEIGGLFKKLTWANIKATLKTYFDTLYVTLSGNQTVAGIKTFTSNIVGDITGNSATATKLQDERTINGVAFDGTANISVGLDSQSGLITSSFTLNNTHKNKLLVCGGTFTISLPNTALKSGDLFIMRNTGTGTISLAINGNNWDLTRASILPGETLIIQNDGSGASSFYRFVSRSKDFASNVNPTAGYTYLPNGVVMQWGRSTANIAPGGTLNITLPLAFPTDVFYSDVAVLSTSTNNNLYVPFVGITTLSNLAITNNDVDSAITQIRWFSIGY